MSARGSGARAALDASKQAITRAARNAVPRRGVGAVQVADALAIGPERIVGWAYRDADELMSVAVLLDDEVVAIALLGPAPDDVVAARPETRAVRACGWVASVDLGDRTGTVRVGALATFASGLVIDLPPVTAALVPPPPGCIEWPVGGDTVTAGTIAVRGWAAPAGGLARVELLVDGREAGAARPLVDRPARGSGDAGPTLDGFEHKVEVTAPSATIDLRVVDRLGTAVVLPGSLITVVDAPARHREESARLETLAARVRSAHELVDDQHPIQIFACTHRLDLGGGQLYLVELLRLLLEHEDVSCVVVSSVDGPLRDDLEAAGATVHVTPFPVDDAYAYESRLVELSHLVTAHRCNVAIVNTAVAGIGADLARRLGLPTLWAIHESFAPDEHWLDAYFGPGMSPYVLERWFTALAHARLIFEAEATRQLYATAGTDPAHLSVVPYGVPVDAIDRYRAEHDRAELRAGLGLPAEATIMLCVGTFEPRKAQGLLVSAFGRATADLDDTALVLVGAIDGDYTRALRRHVQDLGLEERVRIVPVESDVYAWYAAADVFVLASDIESMPRTALEAMGFGLPVVATRAFGVAELIDDGISGDLVDIRDGLALEQGLRRMLERTPSERETMGRAGAAKVRSGHDSSGYATAYRSMLDALLAQSATTSPGER